MTAANDYPTIALWSAPTSYRSQPSARECRAALAEIDRLRKANKFLSDVLDDVLPTLPITDASIVKIDGHWIRITTNPTEARLLT